MDLGRTKAGCPVRTPSRWSHQPGTHLIFKPVLFKGDVNRAFTSSKLARESVKEAENLKTRGFTSPRQQPLPICSSWLVRQWGAEPSFLLLPLIPHPGNVASHLGSWVGPTCLWGSWQKVAGLAATHHHGPASSEKRKVRQKPTMPALR